MSISYTYSCFDTCEHTNQYGSCDHPKQMFPCCLSALVSLENTILLPTHGQQLIMVLIYYSINCKVLIL